MPSDDLTILLPTTCRETTASHLVVVFLPKAQLRQLPALSREIAARGFCEIARACDLHVYDDANLVDIADAAPAGEDLPDAAEDGALLDQAAVARWRERFRDVQVQNSRNHQMVIDGHGLIWIRHTLKHCEGDTWTSPAIPVADLLMSAGE